MECCGTCCEEEAEVDEELGDEAGEDDVHWCGTVKLVLAKCEDEDDLQD